MPKRIIKNKDPIYGHSEIYLEVDYDIGKGLNIIKSIEVYTEDGQLVQTISQNIGMSAEESNSFFKEMYNIFKEIVDSEGNINNA